MAEYSIQHASEIVDGVTYIVHANHLIDNFNAIISDLSDRLSKATSSAQTITSALTLSGLLTANSGISLASSLSLTSAGTLNLALVADPGTPADGLIWYNSTSKVFKAQINAATVQLATTALIPPNSKGSIFGLILSNNGSTPNTDIDISAGQAMDDTNTDLMVYAGGTKRFSSVFVVGTGNGGSDTGTIPTSGTLHVYLIKRVDTNIVDIFCSTSLTPTLPTSYTLKRRIGSLVTDSAAHMALFKQCPVNPDRFEYTTPGALDVDVVNQSTTAVTRTLAVPTGIQVEAIVNAFVSSGSGNPAVYFRNLDLVDVAPSITATPLAQIIGETGSGGTRSGTGQLRVITSTSGTISTRATGASTTLKICTVGWIDRRGILN